MRGLMQDHPLLISSLLEFAERFHGDTEIVSRRVEGDIHRYTFRDAAGRARQLANALQREELGFGERVASLAWNGYRHFELYYGVSGSGRVLHTINPRMHPDQVQWIVNHAEDKVLCFDLTFLPIVKAIHPHCASVQRYVALCERAQLPQDSGIPNLVSYEEWIASESRQYHWPLFDEQSASSLCYTSGTTGNPKGVLYSHRSTMLHTFAVGMPDSLNLSARDTMLPVVPMFHVNAWGVVYAAAAIGFKLVLPGPALDGKSLYELMESEGVTVASGVPTIWQMLLGHVQQHGLRFGTLRRTGVGGSACPPAMFAEFKRHGVDVLHAWGMTETSPLGTVAQLKREHHLLSADRQNALRLKQGRPVFGVDIKIVDADGNALAHDGETCGELHVKGPWIASGYFRGPEQGTLQDGWFPTGDVATIDADGFMQITDRSKDVIKSGGEWISSIDVENIAMSHPGVALAACIGVFHPKWDERPVVIVVSKPGATLSREEVLAAYEDKIARWQIPDDVIVVDAIPLGATGKVQKNKLREQYAQHLFTRDAACVDR